MTKDPGEKRNLYRINDPRAARLQKRISEYEAAAKKLRENLDEERPESDTLSPMDADMLRALGYSE